MQVLRPGATLVLKTALAPLLFIALWHFISPRYNLPSVLEISSAFVEMIRAGTYWHDILVSTIRGVAGFVIGFLLGSTIGVLTGKIPAVNIALGGLLLFLRWTPVIALIPITIRLAGIGEEPKIFLIAWACFFVTWAYTHVAVSRLGTTYTAWADSLGLGIWRRFTKVFVPAISPALIGAARVSIAIAIIVVVAAELGGTFQDGFFRDGLGYRISRAIETNRNDINIACILTLGGIGLILDGFLVLFAKFGLRRMTRIDFYRNVA